MATIRKSSKTTRAKKVVKAKVKKTTSLWKRWLSGSK